MPIYYHNEDGALFDDNQRLAPSLPYQGGGKYVFNTADELRRCRDNGRMSFEFDEARRNVLAALEEIEERDRYLADIKNEVEWMMSHTVVTLNINSPGLKVLGAAMQRLSLMRGNLRRTSEEDLRSDKPFDPDWCVRPGATLIDWREENNLTTHMAAAKCRMSWNLYRRVEDGEREIDLIIATCLETGTGASVGFWLERERQYREDKAKGKKDISRGNADV